MHEGVVFEEESNPPNNEDSWYVTVEGVSKNCNGREKVLSGTVNATPPFLQTSVHVKYFVKIRVLFDLTGLLIADNIRLTIEVKGTLLLYPFLWLIGELQ